jgi:hypothetical protein
MLAASAGSASLSVGTALGLAETVALTGHAIRREELIFGADCFSPAPCV